MSFPYFISPEQAMRERSEIARKGIARGRSVVAMVYDGGVLFVAENPSRSLQKVSELYDRVGFAAVGRFNEFDNLRRGGIQFADTRGYAYDRRDVTGGSWPTSTHRRWALSSRSRPSPTRLNCVWPRWRTTGSPNRLSCTGSLMTGRSPTNRTSWRWAAPPTRSSARSRSHSSRTRRLPTRSGWRWGAACRNHQHQW